MKEQLNNLEIHAPAYVPPVKEIRQVLNGSPGQSQPRANRPFKKQKVSTFSTILALFLLAVVSVLYVHNIITVNQLVVDVENLKGTCGRIANMNEILRSEINKKSSMERITRIAIGQMGMMIPKQPPIWFDTDDKNGQR